MPRVENVKFGGKVIRRRVGNFQGHLYSKIRDCLWEVRESGKGYEVVGPLNTKDKNHAFGHTLPQNLIDKLATIPEDGMGYHKVNILMNTGKLHREVVVVNSSVVPNYIDVRQIVDIYKDNPDSLPTKIDAMVRSIQEVIDAVQCDPSKPDSPPCSATCPIKNVCKHMNKVVMWGLLSKVYTRSDGQ